MDRSAVSVGAGHLRAEENANREVGGEIVVYEAADGGVRVEVVVGDETVWLTQTQMVDLFGRDQSVISRHIGSLFREGELPEKGNMQILHIASGGDRPTTFCNLDVIISVGYRVKSAQGTRFRQWATGVLREHLVRGYSLDRRRFEPNARELESALTLVRSVAAGEASLPTRRLSTMDGTRFSPIGPSVSDGFLSPVFSSMAFRLFTTAGARQAMGNPFPALAYPTWTLDYPGWAVDYPSKATADAG